MNISINRLTRGDVLTRSTAKHFNLDAFATHKTKRKLLQFCNCVVASVCLSLLSISQAIAADFSFTKIADSTDFASFGEGAALNDLGKVVFIATPRTGNQGIYTSNGEVITELLNTSQFPSLFVSPGFFPISSFDSRRLGINNNGTVAVLAERRILPSTTEQGFFTIRDGTTNVLTTSSNRSVGSNSLLEIDINDLEDRAYLITQSPFASPSTRTTLNVTRTNQPNFSISCTENSTGCSEAPGILGRIDSFAINNQGRVIFSTVTRGFNQRNGIFISNDGSFTNVLETGAYISDFNDNGEAILLSSNFSSDFIRLLNSNSGTLRTITDTVVGSFSSFSNAAVNNNGEIAFNGKLKQGSEGIFTGSDPIANKVIATGDTLFGSTVISLNFLPQGLNNKGQIAFAALLGNGTRGIYRAESGVEIPQQQPLPSVENAFSLSKIVDISTPIPNTIGNFTSFNILSFDGDNVFIGVPGFEQQGIYKVSNGTIFAIADQNTTIPGGNGTFTSIGTPSIDGDNVVFRGSGMNQQQGIYIRRGDTPVSVIVDQNTSIPNGIGNFSAFSLVIANKNNVVFTGSSINNGQEGIYISRNGILEVIADRNTPIPGGTGNFTSFNSRIIAVFENNVVISGSGASGQQGIYIYRDGILQVLADRNTPIPGGRGNFTSFDNFVVDENNVVFTARGSSSGAFGALVQEGIYLFRDGIMQLIADANTPIPGGTGNFSNLSSVFLTTNGKNAFFRTTYNVNQPNGIYIIRDGVVQVLVDSNTNIPSSLSKFGEIGNYIIDGDNVAFVGSYNNINFGIYALIGDRLLKVVDLDSRIDGKRISTLSDLRFSGNSLVFLATLSDGTRAILRADLITNK